MGARIRYLGYDVSMPDGEFVIGRGPGCRLCLNDPIVSRRHAIVRVAAGVVTIEDLGSRNGVIVNKQRIEGRRVLVDGDAIVIGGQELTFHQDQPGTSAAPPSSGQRPARAPRLDAPPEGYGSGVTTTVGQSVVASEQRLEAFAKIGQVANGALLRGSAAEAERVLERPLAEVLSTSRCGLDVEPPLVHFAAQQAARLAEATRKAYWIDYIFDLYSISGYALPSEVIDTLSSLAGAVGPVDTTTIKLYLAVRAKAVARDPVAATVHRRIEELARQLGVRTSSAR